MHAPTGGVAKPSSAARATSAPSGAPAGRAARRASAAAATSALPTRTPVCPRRSTRRPSAGPPAPWATASAPATSPAAAKEPVRAWTWTSVPIVSIASGRRARIEAAKTGEVAMAGMLRMVRDDWSHEKIQFVTGTRDQLEPSAPFELLLSVSRDGAGDARGADRGPAAPGDPRGRAARRHARAVDARPRAPARRLAPDRGRRLRAAGRRGLPRAPPGRAAAGRRGGGGRVRGGAARARRPSRCRGSTSARAARTCPRSRAGRGRAACATRWRASPTRTSSTAIRAASSRCASRSPATSGACGAWSPSRGGSSSRAATSRGSGSSAARSRPRGCGGSRSRTRARRSRGRSRRARGWSPCPSRSTAPGSWSTRWPRPGPARWCSRRRTSTRPASCSRRERRAALVAWLRESGAIAIEDDYDAEYRYDRAAVGALQGLDPDRVVYAGSASKTLAPALRLGWMAVPAALLDAVRHEKALSDQTTARIEQHAMADFIGRGELDRHLRRMRLSYRARRDATIAAVRVRAPGRDGQRHRRRAARDRHARDGRRRGGAARRVRAPPRGDLDDQRLHARRVRRAARRCCSATPRSRSRRSRRGWRSSPRRCGRPNAPSVPANVSYVTP